jgi:hypothetical protein
MSKNMSFQTGSQQDLESRNKKWTGFPMSVADRLENDPTSLKLQSFALSYGTAQRGAQHKKARNYFLAKLRFTIIYHPYAPAKAGGEKEISR